jgi:hypothetical protein
MEKGKTVIIPGVLNRRVLTLMSLIPQSKRIKVTAWYYRKYSRCGNES